MTIPEIAADGRTARRERGRIAVIDALVDLLHEGHAPPTTDAIAERAGVSVASLFRYFPTLEDLQQQTTERFMERYAHLLELPEIGIGPLADRADRYALARLTLYENIAPIARFARARAGQQPLLAQHLAALHRRHASITRRHFAPELDGHPAAVRSDRVAVITCITSFESFELVRHDLARSRARTRRVWAWSIQQLIT